MESPRRTLAKTISWQTLGICTMTLLGLWQTGSLGVSLSIAISAASTGVLMFYLHERVWARVRWGFRMPQRDDA